MTMTWDRALEIAVGELHVARRAAHGSSAAERYAEAADTVDQIRRHLGKRFPEPGDLVVRMVEEGHPTFPFPRPRMEYDEEPPRTGREETMYGDARFGRFGVCAIIAAFLLAYGGIILIALLTS